MQSRRTREGSRLAQLVQQAAIPSWMHGTGAPSVQRASAPSRASFRTDVASDVLSQIGASMKAPQHNLASAAPAKMSAAGDILALLEANLQAPSTQRKLPALHESSEVHQLAADDVREIDKLLPMPAPPQKAVTQHHGSANDVYGSESAMQQLPGLPDLGYNTTVQQPMTVYASARTAQRPEQEDHGWIIDMPAYGGAQGSFATEFFPADHRYDRALPMRISAIDVYPTSAQNL